MYGIVAKAEPREQYAIITAEDGTQHLIETATLKEMDIVELEPCHDETGIAHITKVLV